jgi:hypothetical protein
MLHPPPSTPCVHAGPIQGCKAAADGGPADEGGAMETEGKRGMAVLGSSASRRCLCCAVALFGWCVAPVLDAFGC